MRYIEMVILGIFIFSFSILSTMADSPRTKSVVHTKEVLKGQGIIWGLDFLPGSRIIFTQKDGKISVFNEKANKLIHLNNPFQSEVIGQGGMLDVTVHPDFVKNQLVYFSYTLKKKGQYTTALGRAKLRDDRLGDAKILLEANAFGSKGIHFGSRVVFDSQMYLYLSVGDRGERDKAQSLQLHNGKILRLTSDGKVPRSNPFSNRKNVLPEIWSLGHRNPQGLYFEKETGILWEQEHGPQGGDEINVVKKGKNYGWPIITYGREYWGPKIGEGTAKKGLEQPVKFYSPSIAPSGLLVYSGKRFKGWKGNIFSGALKLTHLNRVVVDKGKPVFEERLFQGKGLRIRDVNEGPGGYIYFSTDQGSIYKITEVGLVKG